VNRRSPVFLRRPYFELGAQDVSSRLGGSSKEMVSFPALTHGQGSAFDVLGMAENLSRSSDDKLYESLLRTHLN
jgi:hypothetical protein